MDRRSPPSADRRVELPGRARGAVLQKPGEMRQVRRPRQQDRRATELERAAGAADLAALRLTSVGRNGFRIEVFNIEQIQHRLRG